MFTSNVRISIGLRVTLNFGPKIGSPREDGLRDLDGTIQCVYIMSGGGVL